MLFRSSVYNDKLVRQFAIMTVVWGVVGMLVGGLIAWNRLRERDPRAARNLLWVGIGTTALNLVFYLAGGRL